MAENWKTNKDKEFDHACWNQLVIYDLDQQNKKWDLEAYSRIALQKLYWLLERLLVTKRQENGFNRKLSMQGAEW